MFVNSLMACYACCFSSSAYELPASELPAPRSAPLTASLENQIIIIDGHLEQRINDHIKSLGFESTVLNHRGLVKEYLMFISKPPSHVLFNYDHPLMSAQIFISEFRKKFQEVPIMIYTMSSERNNLQALYNGSDQKVFFIGTSNLAHPLWQLPFNSENYTNHVDAPSTALHADAPGFLGERPFSRDASSTALHADAPEFLGERPFSGDAPSTALHADAPEFLGERSFSRDAPSTALHADAPGFLGERPFSRDAPSTALFTPVRSPTEQRRFRQLQPLENRLADLDSLDQPNRQRSRQRHQGQGTKQRRIHPQEQSLDTKNDFTQGQRASSELRIRHIPPLEQRSTSELRVRRHISPLRQSTEPHPPLGRSPAYQDLLSVFTRLDDLSIVDVHQTSPTPDDLPPHR